MAGSGFEYGGGGQGWGGGEYSTNPWNAWNSYSDPYSQFTQMMNYLSQNQNQNSNYTPLQFPQPVWQQPPQTIGPYSTPEQNPALPDKGAEGDTTATNDIIGKIMGAGGGGMPTLTTTAPGMGGMMGGPSGISSLASTMAQAMMRGQMAMGANSPDLSKMGEDLYGEMYKPDIQKIRKEGAESRQKYTSGLWGSGRGFSSVGPQKMAEAKTNEDNMVNQLIQAARLAARMQAMREIQFGESSPTMMLGAGMQNMSPYALQILGLGGY